MSKKYTIFLFTRVRMGRRKKENNEERRKNRPDGNCNNITLDQTSTYPHPKWWFGIFFSLRMVWGQSLFLLIFFRCLDRARGGKRVISGWIAEAAECDGCGMWGRASELPKRRKIYMFGRRVSFPFRGSIMDIFNAAQHARLLLMLFHLMSHFSLRFRALEKSEKRKNLMCHSWRKL